MADRPTGFGIHRLKPVCFSCSRMNQYNVKKSSTSLGHRVGLFIID